MGYQNKMHLLCGISLPSNSLRVLSLKFALDLFCVLVNILSTVTYDKIEDITTVPLMTKQMQ